MSDQSKNIIIIKSSGNLQRYDEKWAQRFSTVRAIMWIFCERGLFIDAPFKTFRCSFEFLLHGHELFLFFHLHHKIFQCSRLELRPCNFLKRVALQVFRTLHEVEGKWLHVGSDLLLTYRVLSQTQFPSSSPLLRCTQLRRHERKELPKRIDDDAM